MVIFRRSILSPKYLREEAMFYRSRLLSGTKLLHIEHINTYIQHGQEEKAVMCHRSNSPLRYRHRDMLEFYVKKPNATTAIQGAQTRPSVPPMVAPP